MSIFGWQLIMGGHKILNQKNPHFLTFTTVEWVDIFTRKEYKNLIIESLTYCIKNKRLRIYAYVIMTNHIHLICQTDHEIGLSGFVRDFKKYTSRKLTRVINTNKESRRSWMTKIFQEQGLRLPSKQIHKVWQSSSKPIELESPNWINQKIHYIHNNPVKAGIVNKPEHYIFSSASNYVNGTGILPVEVVDLGFDIGYVN